MDEWMAGVALMNEAGKQGDGKINEGQFVGDILGLESQVLHSVYFPGSRVILTYAAQTH